MKNLKEMTQEEIKAEIKSAQAELKYYIDSQDDLTGAEDKIMEMGSKIAYLEKCLEDAKV